jgi:cytochrome c
MKFACITAMIAVTVIGTGCSRSNALHPNATSSQASAPDLMIQYGCPTCHVIPHVPGAVGKVGPSLDDLAQRSYLAGTLQNSPGNLVHWIQHPQQIHPGTAMPEMGVTSADAVRIAAFLQTNN